MAYEKVSRYSLVSPILSKSVLSFNSPNMGTIRADIYVVIETAKQIILHPNGNPKLAELFVMRDRKQVAHIYETTRGIEIDWTDKESFEQYVQRENEEIGE